MHNTYGRQPQQSSFSRNQPGVPTSRGGISSAGTNSGVITQRPSTHSHPPQAQQTTAQQILYQPHHLMPYIYNNQRIAATNFGQNNMQYSYSPTQYFVSSHGLLVPQQQRANGTAAQHIQTAAQLSGSVGGNVAVAGSTQLPSHQPNPHQVQLATHTQLLAPGGHHQMVSATPSIYPMPIQRTTPDTKKRFRNRLAIIDPSNGEDILTSMNLNNSSSYSSSSNTHSSALKIEAPSPPPTVASPAVHPTLESTGNTANSNEHDQPIDQLYSGETEAINIDEPPHTPVVSAIADGPSIDITPKQSKTIKRR